MAKFLLPGDSDFPRLQLSGEEAAVLLSLIEQLLELLGEGGFPHHFDPHDPFAQLLGLGSEITTPEDPVLRRLLPNAYADPEAADEYRRYTEANLRRAKQGGAELIRVALAGFVDEGVDSCVIAEIETGTWLKVLNDLRLALGVRLEVTNESYEQFELMAQDDPSKALFSVYFWLGWLQEDLLALIIR